MKSDSWPSAFNEMTRQLSEQRERLVQTERVAAWRELARRLAHELKNPLFPLQLTVENLQRAREQTPEQFDEVFSGIHGDPARRAGKSEGHRQPLQRFCQDAAAGVRIGGCERIGPQRRQIIRAAT